jgi:hypothetical protein
MADDNQIMAAYFNNGEWVDGPDVLLNEWTDERLNFGQVREILGYSKFHDYRTGEFHFNITVWRRTKYPDYMIQIETPTGCFEQIYTDELRGVLSLLGQLVPIVRDSLIIDILGRSGDYGQGIDKTGEAETLVRRVVDTIRQSD